MGKIDYSKLKEYRDEPEEIHNGIVDHGGTICFVEKQIKIHGEDRDSGWYFYDETWSDIVGPYQTKELCKQGLTRYAIHLEGGSS